MRQKRTTLIILAPVHYENLGMRRSKAFNLFIQFLQNLFSMSQHDWNALEQRVNPRLESVQAGIDTIKKLKLHIF